jgi:phosphate starvation-inducible membrane PsiE
VKLNLSRVNLRLLSNAMIYLLVTILWSLVTLKMNSYESQSGYFQINPLMQFKIILPAVVFWGRRLLFNEYRQGRRNPLVFLLALFLVGWSVFNKLINIEDLSYGLLVAADIITWVFLIRETVETIREIVSYWKDLPRINYALVNEIWTKIEKDLIRFGIWLTSLIGLSFFYS